MKLRDCAGGNQKWAFAHLRGFPPPTLEPERCRVTEEFTSHNQGLIAIEGKTSGSLKCKAFQKRNRENKTLSPSVSFVLFSFDS